MGEFWVLFKESVIIQAVLALLFAATVCTLFLRGMPVPGELLALLGTVIGYYFGSKNQAAVTRSVVSALQSQAPQDPRVEGLIDQERDTRDYS
jgi:hypothetical protein